MNPHYVIVAQRAGHRCEYCRAPEAIFNFPFEVEHVIPPVKGGAEREENLALACRSCNLFKSNHTEHQTIGTGELVALFHPRQQRWNEHFRIASDSGEVVGKTPEGRATVECLRMNTEAQIAARRQWMRLGLFP